jgi:hypothetical protein
MLAWLATFPPIVPAIVLSLVYAYRAAARWRWDMLPDAALLGLYVWRPSLALFAFVVALIVVRWTPRLAGELAAMFHLGEYTGWTARTIAFCLPAITMSSAGADARAVSGPQVVHVPVSPTGMGDNGDEVVGTDGDALESGFELPRVSRHNTQEELVIYLASQRRGDGKPLFSSNQICELMESRKGFKGMQRPEVQAIVRQVQHPTQAEYPPVSPEAQQAREELGLQ